MSVPAREEAVPQDGGITTREFLRLFTGAAAATAAVALFPRSANGQTTASLPMAVDNRPQVVREVEMFGNAIVHYVKLAKSMPPEWRAEYGEVSKQFIDSVIALRKFVIENEKLPEGRFYDTKTFADKENPTGFAFNDITVADTAVLSRAFHAVYNTDLGKILPALTRHITVIFTRFSVAGTDNTLTEPERLTAVADTYRQLSVNRRPRQVSALELNQK